MAPRTEHTAFVFLGQLLKLKGTDASWKGDEEVPSKFQGSLIFFITAVIQFYRRQDISLTVTLMFLRIPTETLLRPFCELIPKINNDTNGS